MHLLATILQEKKCMASSLKITDSFSVASSSGEVFNVEEHTRCETARVAGVKRETMGKAFLKTDEGRGVLKNDNGSFSIPSLGMTAHRAPDTST
jgi:hypothetical protein